MPAVTAQVVSAFLRRAGFERSEEWTTAIRGGHDTTKGFKVRAGDRQGEVRVTAHIPPPINSGMREESRAMAERYAEALRQGGYEVSIDDHFLAVLRVTGD